MVTNICKVANGVELAPRAPGEDLKGSSPDTTEGTVKNAGQQVVSLVEQGHELDPVPLVNRTESLEEGGETEARRDGEWREGERGWPWS